MQKVISDLGNAIEKYYGSLLQVEDLSAKPNPDKWSKQEGHLIDSAQNNMQRFIRVQYEDNVHILYHPDNWVAFNDYQNRNLKELVELWYLLNKQIVSILQKLPESKYEKLMSFDKDVSIKNTTLFIAEDYVKHMTHHLESILIQKLT